MKAAAWLGVMACLLAAAACGAARRSAPLREPLALNAQAEQGRVVFMEKCNQCHPQGEAGLGPAINDKPFPDFLKKFQVRHGLGAMPSFPESEINDEQLSDLMEYLGELRKARKRS